MSILKFQDKKVHGYLIEKETLVKEGRKVSGEIEKIETKIDKTNEEERKYTEGYEPKELIEEGNSVFKQIEALEKQLNEIGDKIMAEKLKQIPESVVKRHHELRDEKEKLERVRNKIALKVQKIKDRVAPLVKKLLSPHLNEYEDAETVVVKGHDIVITTFSYLEDFKKSFQAKKSKMEPVSTLKELATDEKEEA